MLRIAIIVAAGIALAGCNTVSWEKPGASAQQKKVDLAQCEYEAEQGSPIMGRGDGPAIQAGIRSAQLESLCMKARGYERQQTAAAR